MDEVILGRAIDWPQISNVVAMLSTFLQCSLRFRPGRPSAGDTGNTRQIGPGPNPVQLPGQMPESAILWDSAVIVVKGIPGECLMAVEPAKRDLRTGRVIRMSYRALAARVTVSIQSLLPGSWRRPLVMKVIPRWWMMLYDQVVGYEGYDLHPGFAGGTSERIDLMDLPESSLQRG